MKITDIQVEVMGVPADDGVTPRRNWIFVRVSTDAGIEGIGEATTEWHEMAVKAQIESELRPRLLGLDPTDIEYIWQRCFREFWWRGGIVQTSAISGIDIALWDISGKSANLPVFKMLGGKCRRDVRCYARGESLSKGLIEQAKEAAREGFTAFKHGWGTPVDPFDELKQVDVAVAEIASLREVLGPDVDIMIDCAGIFSPQAAHKLLAQLRPVRMFFVEEPTSLDTVEPTRELRHNFPDIKVALGERLITRWACRPWFENRALDICQVDVCHTGGISELVKIGRQAETYGITMAPHNPYGPVAMAASAHACAAMPNFLILEHCRLRPWFDRVQTRPVPLTHGAVDMLEMERRPGLGVELDWDVIRSRPFQRLAPRYYSTSDGASWMNM